MMAWMEVPSVGTYLWYRLCIFQQIQHMLLNNAVLNTVLEWYQQEGGEESLNNPFPHKKSNSAIAYG